MEAVMNQNSQLELKNSSFCVRFDPATGGVTHLFLQADPHGMNWAQGEAQWGTPAPIPSAVHVSSDNSQSSCDGYGVRQVSFRDGCLRAVYQSNLVTVTALRDFSPNGNFRERYTIQNHTAAPVFLPRGSFGIYTTFNDNYQDIQTCLTATPTCGAAVRSATCAPCVCPARGPTWGSCSPREAWRVTASSAKRKRAAMTGGISSSAQGF